MSLKQARCVECGELLTGWNKAEIAAKAKAHQESEHAEVTE